MKKTIQTILLSFFMLQVSAKESLNVQKSDTTSFIYPICLHFQSVCCGVPDEQKLKQWVNTFKKKYGIRRMSAVHVGPLGREGEYDLYFTLKGLKKETKRSFISNIKKQAKNWKDPGMVTIEENAALNKSNLPVSASYDTLYY